MSGDTLLMAQAKVFADKLRTAAHEQEMTRSARPHLAPNHLFAVADCLDALRTAAAAPAGEET